MPAVYRRASTESFGTFCCRNPLLCLGNQIDDIEASSPFIVVNVFIETQGRQANLKFSHMFGLSAA
jgi:hypothetical protein